jgi:ADP-heptose:LPS heptosyltransferase
LAKFLIIRLSSIGDIVLTTPVVRCLKNQVEDTEIHYLTKSIFSQVIQNNPYIDKIHLFENNLSQIIKLLRNEHFDYIIDLHHNLRSFIIKNRLNVLSFSFKKLNFQKWLMVQWKINKLPNLHIVDRYLETIALFDVSNDNRGLDFFISPEYNNVTHTLPPLFQTGYIGYVIGAKHATKQLPLEKMIDLCRKLQHPIVLLGGSEDMKTGNQLVSVLGITVFNACGKYNLQQSAALVRDSKVIITHDTGLMHIAAAFKKPILSIWGNTIPEFGMYPYSPGGENIQFEVPNLHCRPCSKIGYSSCPKKHFKCMINQDVKEIAYNADMLFKKTGENSII